MERKGVLRHRLTYQGGRMSLDFGFRRLRP
jgi:hypothetical protein